MREVHISVEDLRLQYVRFRMLFVLPHNDSQTGLHLDLLVNLTGDLQCHHDHAWMPIEGECYDMKTDLLGKRGEGRVAFLQLECARSTMPSGVHGIREQMGQRLGLLVNLTGVLQYQYSHNTKQIGLASCYTSRDLSFDVPVKKGEISQYGCARSLQPSGMLHSYHRV